MKDILFIRKYPTYLAKGYFEGLLKSYNSLFRTGQRENVNGHEVTFFFPGYGRHIRKLPSGIIERINSGEISDIVDFGAGGALDPDYREGDLVVSSGEVNTEGSRLLNLNRRVEVKEIVKKIAQETGRKCYHSRILTSSKVVARRLDRLRYYGEENAGVVQMEHYWFIENLKRSVNPDAFNKLYFTHIELVADSVPKLGSSVLEGVNSFFHALDVCVFRNNHYLGKLKTRFLKEFVVENGQD